ncbi:MAG: glycoside hydrolase family 127 protein, partial [Chloroflexota bacterium]|nr:glycoside hydrolase family 127 protein [Chloroflexota bacterium]
GKRDLLDVALRSADLLDRTFGPGKKSIWPGHPVTEIGLVKLYRVTGDDRYLQLAKFMADERGPDGREGSGREYNQSHAPVVEQSEAVGHAVRATYLYAGMADVAAMTGESRYIETLDRMWQDVVGRKLYVTGGIGATAQGEAFGPAYHLPNLTAYSETCAAIANIFWNHRLFLLHADARYIDVLERSLYNVLLAGVSLEGIAFFYDNPLESDGTHQRSPWFECACCPSNVARFLPALPGYVYAQQDDTIYVNLFVAGSAEIQLASGQVVTLTQETRYPWDGRVRLAVKASTPEPFTIKVRIPGWACDEVVPGDLYRFVDKLEESARITLNSEPVDMRVDQGYVSLTRTWQPGDVIECDLPMPVRQVVAHEQVEADRGRVALQRGPLVYCVEWTDNPDGSVRDLVLPDSSTFAAEWKPDLLNGVIVLKGRALRQRLGDSGQPVLTEQDFTAIPYYAWAHRGPGEMLVWLRAEQSVEPRS